MAAAVGGVSGCGDVGEVVVVVFVLLLVKSRFYLAFYL